VIWWSGARHEAAEIKGRGIAPSVIGWLNEQQAEIQYHCEISANARARHRQRRKGLADAASFFDRSLRRWWRWWWWW